MSENCEEKYDVVIEKLKRIVEQEQQQEEQERLQEQVKRFKDEEIQTDPELYSLCLIQSDESYDYGDDREYHGDHGPESFFEIPGSGGLSVCHGVIGYPYHGELGTGCGPESYYDEYDV